MTWRTLTKCWRCLLSYVSENASQWISKNKCSLQPAKPEKVRAEAGSCAATLDLQTSNLRYLFNLCGYATCLRLSSHSLTICSVLRPEQSISFLGALTTPWSLHSRRAKAQAVIANYCGASADALALTFDEQADSSCSWPIFKNLDELQIWLYMYLTVYITYFFVLKQPCLSGCNRLMMFIYQAW